ncbi:MAG: PAS domain S-box protein, partial [Methanoregula sp.]|nr:PAS domain S-box protein [Methanoregula sp.]
IFTGKGREEIAVEAFENGADFYLQKGGQPKAQFSELLKKVESAVRRRRAENSLRESEEKYRNLIERATDGIVVLQDGKIRFCNQHSADFVGYSILDVTGRPFTDFVAPEELPQLQKNYERRMAGEKLPGTYETVLIRKDGSRIFAELNAGLVEYEGKPADMLIIRDVTQRKHMEAELQKKNVDLHTALEKLHQQDAVLHKKEEKFRMIFDTAPNLILSVNRDGIIVDCNLRVRDVLGYEKREINGQSLAMILFPDDQVTAKNCLGESMTIGAVYNRHVRMVKKDGQLIDVSINATGIKDQSGRYFRTVCIIDDVTARFAADELLRRREEKFRKIFDTAMTLITSITLDGTIVDCNQRIQDVLGYSKAEIIGQPISLIIHPEDLEQARDSFVQIQKTGVYYDKHFRMIRKDGMIIRVSINATGIKDRHDKYFRVICIIEDITARLLAEETLRITQEKFSKAFHAAPDAIVISDLSSGRIIECNDAASVIFGYTHDELIGHSARELKILKNDEDWEVLIWRVKTQGRVEQFELVERRKSGELFNVSIAADTMTVGDSPYLITIVRDVTERTRTEEALRLSEARYKNVVEDQTECIARFLPDGTYVFVNEAFLRYFHTTREAIIGHRLSLDIPEEDQKIIREHFLALTRENPVATVVHRIQKEGGAIVWLRWSDRAIFDPNGTLIEYQSVGRDITEQKLVEEALRNSDETMRGIINHLPDPTFVINTKGEVVAWNKAMEDLTGVRRKDMVGKKEYEYALPFYGKRIPILIDLTLHYDEESKKKYVYVRREGETLVAETNIAHPREKSSLVLWGKASPLYDKDGKLSGAIETIRDITERKQEEIRLNHAVRQLNLLTSVTRHDILNQLLALKGYLDLSH